MTDLWFIKDPTRKSTYIAGYEQKGKAFALFAIGVGTAILGYLAFEITRFIMGNGPVR